MEVTNLLRLRLQKYFFPFLKQVLKSKLSKQDFNWNMSKADKYNILFARVLCGLPCNLRKILGSIIKN
jgi:hypothetical protein